MAELLLGIDIGTYSSKGVLVQPDGTVLRSHVVEHQMSIPRPGWAEQDADEVWWTDVVAICKTMLDGSPYTGEDVAGIALSAIGPCMLPLDAKGKPLRPGILYGVDARASHEIEQLNRAIGEDNIFAHSGMTLSSQAVGPKILWMKNNEPDLWEKVEHITTASSYLIYRLTGEKVIDRHTASHYMPLIDIGKVEWSDKYSEHIVELEKLPPIGWSDEVAGYVSASGGKETGLMVGTPVAVGAVDALSEGISVGAMSPGDLMIMYGSTAFFILVQDVPTPDQRMWTVAGAFEGQYNLAAGMATTGSLTRWFRDELAPELEAEDAYEVLFSAAGKIPPGAEGLLVLPYFSGERTPINDPDARGVFAGLSLAHTRAHLFRAVLEGVAFGINHNIETFQSIGTNIKRVIAVGGGAQSRLWLQIVSDVAGVNQILPDLTIGASYGDAFLAGLASGLFEQEAINDWVKVKDVIEPDPSNQEKYRDLFQEYLNLYGSTCEIIHRLSGADAV